MERRRVTLAIFGLAFLTVILVRVYHGAVRRQYSFREAEAGPLDLNDASMIQLVQLPGVEEALAFRIVREREKHGPFENEDDVRLRVNGIGEKKLEAMLQHSFVGPDS